MPPKAPTKAPAGQRPATFDHLKKKQPLELTIGIVLDNEAAEAHEAAAMALETARLTGKPTAALEEAERKARAALDAETVTMRFRSIGRKAYDALLLAHPPTEADKAEAKEAGTEPPPWDIGTFAPALVAASCVEPRMSEAEVHELWDAWNAAESAQCWIAALYVNTQRRVAELGKGSG